MGHRDRTSGEQNTKIPHGKWTGMYIRVVLSIGIVFSSGMNDTVSSTEFLKWHSSSSELDVDNKRGGSPCSMLSFELSINRCRSFLPFVCSPMVLIASQGEGIPMDILIAVALAHHGDCSSRDHVRLFETSSMLSIIVRRSAEPQF